LPEAALEAAAQIGGNVLAIGALYTIAPVRQHWERRFHQVHGR
jgi:hypothetical protein